MARLLRNTVLTTGSLAALGLAAQHAIKLYQERHDGGAKECPLSADQLELLKGNETLFSHSELELIKMLLEEGQAHVVVFWAYRGVNDAAKKRLVRQLCKLDRDYPGGLRTYLRNARALLKQSAAGANPYEGYTPRVPEGVSLSVASGSGRWEQYEERGMAAARHTAFVLVAGGLGERLGYGDIKVSLPVETATNTTFLELYIQSILALERKTGAPRPLPLAIMTSDDTHSATLALLKKHAFFGARRRQVRLMKQEKVACLADGSGALALDAVDPYSVQTKPHGHGDVHALLHSTGIARQWQQQGFKWVAFFQDTNSLVFRGLVPTLGVSAERDYDVNSLCVPRVAKEAIGAIARLEHTGGSAMTINVEYNQLDPLLRATVNKDGDVNGANGLSPFPGNINQIVLKLEPYVAQLDASGGVIAEFVNPKYKDAARRAFKKATRLECMMQDYPKTLPPSARVGFTTVSEVWAAYSPVKNSVAEAQAKAASGSPTHSATSGEIDVYNANARLLSLAGPAMQGPAPVEFNGLHLHVGPRVVLSPSFASTFAELKSKVPNSPTAMRVTTRSTLVVIGSDVHIEGLDLDGTLVIVVADGASLTVKDLTVRNGGWALSPLTDADDAPEALRIRGFTTSKQHGCMIHVTKGSAEIDSRLEDQDVIVVRKGEHEERKPWVSTALSST